MNNSSVNTPFLLIGKMHTELRQKSNQFGQSNYRERKRLLKSLKKSILTHQEKMEKAMHLDFNKPKIEVQLTESYVLKSSIDHLLKNLRNWMEAKRVQTPLSLFGTKGYTQAQAKGSVLIISPWNYPFTLTLGPLACAIAAGNTVMLKPSESTPHCSEVLSEIVAEVFTCDEVFVAKGDVEVSKQVLTYKWDHIYYTGGAEVGKAIMKSAAEQLCSVTLELGGKSPCIVDETADLKNAAKRIVWGKFLNAGQTCVAPDYLLVHEKVKSELISKMKELISEMYNDSTNDLASIVNNKHFERLKSALDQAIESGANALTGGKYIDDSRQIEPTLLEGVDSDGELMQNEIFGPILPILSYSNENECLDIINYKEYPLAMYIFSSSKTNIRRLISNTKAGTTAINTAIVQFNHPYLPFGGIGHSGMGKGHGKYGFDEFSNLRSFVHQTFKWNTLELIRPPFTRVSELVSKLTIKYL